MDKKKLLIGLLCTLMMIMAVGYALLAQQLSVTGSASITSNWQVEITNIEEIEKSTGTTTNSTNYTATTASFNTSLTSPGDYALYEVTVTNKGTLDAVLAAKPTITTGNNEAVIYELDGIKKGDKILKNNQTDTFTIKVQYNPNTTSQPATLTSNMEVTLNYEQNLGQVSPYDAYAVGDVVSFSNINWRVIETSSGYEDYVLAMKDLPLTAMEIGENYSYKQLGVAWPMMGFYWSSTCYKYIAPLSGMYGTDSYETTDSSGCSGHNDYEGSKIKEMLEQHYLPTLNVDGLKEIEGYKIRIITVDELQRNLGLSTNKNNNMYQFNTNKTPSWVYQQFQVPGEYGYVDGYWTMTPNANNSGQVWHVVSDGIVATRDIQDGQYYGSAGVRPVINLLKSAIE